MEAMAVVLNGPENLALSRLPLDAPGPEDVVVDIKWSGISTGTERLLYSGRMPPFPGMGYPLVPGYESVGRIATGHGAGDLVFVPGARCFGDVRGLFGGAASRVVVRASRITPFDARLGERGVLLALAATARHALVLPGVALPDLIIGHGVLGRMLARLAVLSGARPVVWERNPDRTGGAQGYDVIDPAADDRRDYRAIYDVSGDATLLDSLIGRLAPGGEVVLAGFLQRPPELRLPAGLHAGGAHPHRRPVVARRPHRRRGPGRVRRAVDGRPDYPSPRRRRCGPGLPHRLRTMRTA